MDERFKEKYGVYDGIKVDAFKHIPEISFYNHNYYIGLKRNGSVVSDLLFACSNDDNMTDWYIVNGESVTYIGYEFTEDGTINLSDKNS